MFLLIMVCETKAGLFVAPGCKTGGFCLDSHMPTPSLRDAPSKEGV